MRKALALGTVAFSVVALAATAAPAQAADATATFTVVAGSLSIASAATTVDLGSSTGGLLGTTVTGALPKVTVTDNRGSLAGWNSKISSTDFTATVGGTVRTVTASNVKAYIPTTAGPTLLSAALSAVPTTTALAPATGVALSGTAQVLVTATTTGSNQVEYTPTVQVTIGSAVLAATYSGTITHTVI